MKIPRSGSDTEVVFASLTPELLKIIRQLYEQFAGPKTSEHSALVSAENQVIFYLAGVVDAIRLAVEGERNENISSKTPAEKAKETLRENAILRRLSKDAEKFLIPHPKGSSEGQAARKRGFTTRN
jgi:hypothetical protein